MSKLCVLTTPISSRPHGTPCVSDAQRRRKPTAVAPWRSYVSPASSDPNECPKRRVDSSDTDSISSFNSSINETLTSVVSSGHANARVLSFNGTDYHSFKRYFLSIADAYRWDDIEKFHRLLFALEGPAQNVVAENAGKINSFDTIYVTGRKYNTPQSYDCVI